MTFFSPLRRVAAFLAAAFLFVGLPTASIAQKPADAKAKAPQEDPEIKMGREAHEQMLQAGLKLVKDPEQQSRIETIGKKLAAIANAEAIPATYGSPNIAPYEYRFFIVDDKDVNAFCLPGGFVYVNRGLLKYVQSDDELAGVLGHEIMHAAHHHVTRLQREQRKLNNQMLLGLLAAIVARVPAEATSNLLTGFQLFALQKVNGHSQNAERDADAGGIELVVKAGYNPVGALTFMERLARDEAARPEVELGAYRTHPPSKERAQAMVNNIEARKMPINRRSVTQYLKVTTRTAPSGSGGEAYELLLDEVVVFRSLSKERVDTAQKSLNTMLDEDIQIYDVKRSGGSVLLRGESLLVFDEKDATLMGSELKPETAAEQSYKALRNVLYRHMLDKTYSGMVAPTRVNDR